jgi:hypothetical protein
MRGTLTPWWTIFRNCPNTGKAWCENTQITHWLTTPGVGQVLLDVHFIATCWQLKDFWPKQFALFVNLCACFNVSNPRNGLIKNAADMSPKSYPYLYKCENYSLHAQLKRCFYVPNGPIPRWWNWCAQRFLALPYVVIRSLPLQHRFSLFSVASGSDSEVTVCHWCIGDKSNCSSSYSWDCGFLQSIEHWRYQIERCSFNGT